MPRQHNPFDDDKAPRTQAERIFEKFGGVRKLMAALDRLGPDRGYNPATLYRWNYPRARKGSNGIIPTAAIPDVLEAARLEGIHLDAVDLDPRKR